MKTSDQFIQRAIQQGHAIVALADGDAHICALDQDPFPDVICAAPGCTQAYDSRLKNLPQLQRWMNGNTARTIENRDNWRNGLCPDHC